MNAHNQRLIAEAAECGPTLDGLAKRPLGALNVRRLAARLVVFTPSGASVERLVACARSEMGSGADGSIVRRVIQHNPDCFWAIARRERFSADAPCGDGYVAFLMLTAEGMERLLDGTLNPTDPDLSLIARQNEPPAGIYVWGLYARGAVAGGIPLVFEKISTPLYRDASLYARAVTEDGHRMLETLGFKRGANFRLRRNDQLHMYRRDATQRETSPVYDNHDEESAVEETSVAVARSMDDLMRVITVRAAVYVAEQRCPYAEEFDGNDFSATHLIGYAGNEPAGCLRIRYFAEFAKLERLAVRREFRHRHLGGQLMQAGVELCRMKGYRRIYGRARTDLLSYYTGLGWRILDGASPFVFSDHEYIEIVYEADPHPKAISIGNGPYVLMRPEGRWHRPGILEVSAARPPSQMHGAAS